MDLVVGRAGAVLLLLESALILSLLPDVHGLDVEVAGPVLAGAAAGRVGEGGAAAS